MSNDPAIKKIVDEIQEAPTLTIRLDKGIVRITGCIDDAILSLGMLELSKAIIISRTRPAPEPPSKLTLPH